VTLDRRFLLQSCRVSRPHPETGQDIGGGIGDGPFVRHNGEYRSLTKHDNVLTVGLTRALELLSRKKEAPRGIAARDRSAPDDGEPVAIYEGRYGPYVKHGKVNASLPQKALP
jgi:DNA topoisomerase-1